MGSALNYAAGRGEGGYCAHPPSSSVQVAQGIFFPTFANCFCIQCCKKLQIVDSTIDETADNNTLIPIPRERAFVSKAKKGVKVLRIGLHSGFIIYFSFFAFFTDTSVANYFILLE